MVNIPDYFARAYALLASQFQIRNPDGSLTNLQKMVKALCIEADKINTQQQLLITMRYLNTAQGVQLDELGEILGLSRDALQSDDSYRQDLIFQVFINSSNATPEEMITILKYLTDASEIWYNELYPASYVMSTNGLTFPENPSDLISEIQKSSPAGVEFVALIATYNTNPFVFSSDPFQEQLFVSIDPNSPNVFNPFEVDPGTGLVPFLIQRGETNDPNFGGGFAEALGQPPNFMGIDTNGAGQMAEAIQM